MAETIIFDLDGLLADTERLHQKAYQTVFAQHGITITDAVYREHWIGAGKGVGDYVKESGLGIDPNVIRREKGALYNQLVDEEAEPMPGALDLLSALDGRKTMGIATSSYTDAAARVLAALGVCSHFSCVIGSDQVARAKPFPDVYLLAAERLGVEPAECVAFEDTAKGIRAATAAGMKSIAVPTTQTRDSDFSMATVVVTSLENVTPAIIDAI